MGSTLTYPHLSPIALDPPFPTRTVTLLTREGAYQTAANRASTHLTYEYVRAHLPTIANVSPSPTADR